jgi:dihydroorotase
MRFDLLIRGGEVIDPGGGNEGRLDVAVRRGRIAAVDRDIPTDAAAHTIDAGGRYVTPGLVDLHTHVYRGVTFWGIDADAVAWRTGVTTFLDVGSAGAFTLQGFRELIAERSTARIRCLLNISSIGLVAETYELANLAYCEADLCARVINANRDLALGVKARIDALTVGENGLEPLMRARQAADATGLPLMVHVTWAPPPLDEILALMRPGDVLTHCATGLSNRLVNDDGGILESARQARERGVVFDVGHGSGSFSWASADKLLTEGMGPDVISSDIHQLSVHGPLFDLPTCMSKFLALGMPLRDVIAAATVNPARVLGMHNEIGTLAPGAHADIALFELERGGFGFYDVHHERHDGSALLRNTLTLVGGRPLPPKPPHPPAPWLELTPAQLQRDADLRQVLEHPALLERPEDLGAPIPLEPPEDSTPLRSPSSDAPSADGPPAARRPR